MIYAELQTRNFTFRTFADSEECARKQLKKAWQKHAKQTQATWTWEDLEDAIAFLWFRDGDTFRDFEPLLSHNTPNAYK